MRRKNGYENNKKDNGSAHMYDDSTYGDSNQCKAADSSGSMSTEMETNSELFITLEENKDYRWNVNDNAGKNSVVHLDTSEGNNCRFRLDHIEKEWYGIKHIKVDGTDRFADVDGKSKDSGAVLHLWESSDSEVKGNNHRQFAFYYIGNDANGNARYYIKNRNSGKWIGYEGKLNNNNPKIIRQMRATESLADHKIRSSTHGKRKSGFKRRRYKCYL